MPILSLGAAVIMDEQQPTQVVQNQPPQGVVSNHPMVTNSLARKKKSERPLAVPPVNLLQEFSHHSYANTTPTSNAGGYANHGFDNT